MRDLTTWRKEITTAMGSVDEWENVEARTLSDEELDKEFDSGYGCSEGKAFTLWTKTRVYFPGVYDGSEWADSAPRHPCDEATSHVGGE
jgi:hypothetical protein